MAVVMVDDYDYDVMQSMTHGMVTREDMSFLRRSQEDLLGGRTGGFVNKYIDAAKGLLDTFDFEGIRSKVNRYRDRFSKRFKQDEISDINIVLDVQNARPKLRGYIMAMPRLRDLYLKGRVEGYGKHYEMQDRTSTAHQVQEYREVMNGAFTGTEEKDEFTTYLDVFDDQGYEALSTMEKIIIRRGWDSIAQWLDENDEDPTSPSGSKL